MCICLEAMWDVWVIRTRNVNMSWGHVICGVHSRAKFEHVFRPCDMWVSFMREMWICLEAMWYVVVIHAQNVNMSWGHVICGCHSRAKCEHVLRPCDIASSFTRVMWTCLEVLLKVGVIRKRNVQVAWGIVKCCCHWRVNLQDVLTSSDIAC